MTGACHRPQMTPEIRIAPHGPNRMSFGSNQPRHPISSPRAGMMLMKSAAMNTFTNWPTTRVTTGSSISGAPAWDSCAAVTCCRPEKCVKSAGKRPRSDPTTSARTHSAIGRNSPSARYPSSRPTGVIGTSPRACAMRRGRSTFHTTVRAAIVGVHIITRMSGSAAGEASPSPSQSGRATSQASAHARRV